MSLPGVEDWMLRGAGPLRGVADELRLSASELSRVEASLTCLLADTAATLGWRGDAADAAQQRQARSGTQLDRAARALGDAATALDTLADLLAGTGVELALLVERHADLVRSSLLERVAPIRIYLQVALSVLDDDARQTRAIADEQVPPLVRRLQDGDRITQAALSRAVWTLQRLGELGAGDGWVGTATTSTVRGVLGRHGVVEDRADRELLDWASTLAGDRRGADALRARLSGLAPEEVADLLLRHPGLAQRLDGGGLDQAAPGSDEALLAAAMAATGAAERSARVAAVFAALSPERRRMLSLLHPSLVGRLDGAPLAERVAANRIQIAAALASERAYAVHAERLDRARPDVRKRVDELVDRAGLVVEVDDVAAAQQRNTDRIAYYQRLQYEELDQPAAFPGRPDRVEHQVVHFDPRDDGTIAELWGPIDRDTRNVGVFVPGTTADLESFDGYSTFVRDLVRADLTGRTSMIAWLGSDMPNAVGADATRNSHAEDAGPALRDFTDGLQLADRLHVTLIGHSYGGAVVGVAEREGLVPDRVVHVESAGAGRGVRSEADYAGGTDVDRYALLAPGDLIAVSQGVEAGPLGHGAGPAGLEGVLRLETGRYGPEHEQAGEMIQGGSSHSDVLTMGSTAWENILGVVRGTQVTPYTPPIMISTRVIPVGPFRWVDQELAYPYEDPEFPDAPSVAVP